MQNLWKPFRKTAVETLAFNDGTSGMMSQPFGVDLRTSTYSLPGVKRALHVSYILPQVMYVLSRGGLGV